MTKPHGDGRSRHRDSGSWDAAGSISEGRDILPPGRLLTSRERMDAMAVAGEAVKLLRAMLPASPYAQRVALALDRLRLKLYSPPTLPPDEEQDDDDPSPAK